MGKTGPVPSGCGANRAILRSRPQRWARLSPRARPCVPRIAWPDSRSQRHPLRECEQALIPPPLAPPKRPRNQPNPPRLPRQLHHRHNVKPRSRRPLVPRQVPQILLRQPPQNLPLVLVHRHLRCRQPLRCPRLHLDKAQHIPLPRHQVQVPRLRPLIPPPRHNMKPLPHQEEQRRQLPALPRHQVLRLFRHTSALGSHPIRRRHSALQRVHTHIFQAEQVAVDFPAFPPENANEPRQGSFSSPQRGPSFNQSASPQAPISASSAT